MTITGYSLRGVRRCDIPGHTDEYGIPVTLQDSDGIVRDGYIYVHPDTTLSVGPVTITVKQLYDLLNDPHQQVQVTMKQMRSSDALFDLYVKAQE